jgi:hypothetical protein
MCDECASRSASKLPRPPRCAQPMKLVRRTMRFGGLRDLYTFECRQCGEWHTEEGSVPSPVVLEFGDAISGILRVPGQAARSIG